MHGVYQNSAFWYLIVQEIDQFEAVCVWKFQINDTKVKLTGIDCLFHFFHANGALACNISQLFCYVFDTFCYDGMVVYDQ